MYFCKIKSLKRKEKKSYVPLVANERTDVTLRPPDGLAIALVRHKGEGPLRHQVVQQVLVILRKGLVRLNINLLRLRSKVSEVEVLVKLTDLAHGHIRLAFLAHQLEFLLGPLHKGGGEIRDK